jgi:hypothetical protein
MAAAARSPAGSPVCRRVTGYDRGPALAEDDKSLVGQTARACCRAATGTSCRALISRTEGSGSPAASIPDRIAAPIASTTCC